MSRCFLCFFRAEGVKSTIIVVTFAALKISGIRHPVFGVRWITLSGMMLQSAPDFTGGDIVEDKVNPAF